MPFSFPKQSPSKYGTLKISVNLGDINLVFKERSRMTFFSPTKQNCHYLNSRKPNRKARHNRNQGTQLANIFKLSYWVISMVGGYMTAQTGDTKCGVRSVKQIHTLQLLHTPPKDAQELYTLATMFKGYYSDIFLTLNFYILSFTKTAELDITYFILHTLCIKIILLFSQGDQRLALAPGQLLRELRCLERVRWGSGSAGNFIHWLHCLSQWNLLWLRLSCTIRRKRILLAFNNFPDIRGQKDPAATESSHAGGGQNFGHAPRLSRVYSFVYIAEYGGLKRGWLMKFPQEDVCRSLPFY